MGGELNCGEYGGWAVSTSNNGQRGRLFQSEEIAGDKQHREDSELRAGTEDCQLEITEHRPEISKRADTHEDDRREQTRLDERIVEKVHDAEVMRNLGEGHFIDRLRHRLSISINEMDKTFTIGGYNAHVATREIGDEDAEGYRHKQERLKLLLNTQIEQQESERVHDEELRLVNDRANRRHIINFLKNILHGASLFVLRKICDIV